MPRKTSEGVKGVLVRLPTKDLPDFNRLTLALHSERLKFFTDAIEEVFFATQSFRSRFRTEGLLTVCRENPDAQSASYALSLRGVRSLPNKATALGWIPLSPERRRTLDASALKMGWSPSRFAMEALYAFLQLCGQRTPLTEIPHFFLLKCADSLSRQLISGAEDDGFEGETHSERWLRETNAFLRLGPQSPLRTNPPKPRGPAMTSDVELG